MVSTHLGNPVRNPFFPTDGDKRIIQKKLTIADTEVNFFGDGVIGFSTIPDVFIHVRVIVTSTGQIRLNLNNCVSALDDDNGILVDYEHPFDAAMAITSLTAKRVGSTSATVEVVIWY